MWEKQLAIETRSHANLPFENLPGWHMLPFLPEHHHLSRIQWRHDYFDAIFQRQPAGGGHAIEVFDTAESKMNYDVMTEA